MCKSELVNDVISNLLENEKQGSNIFNDMNDAIDAVYEAQKVYEELPMQIRDDIIKLIRKVSVKAAPVISKKTVEETGMGDADDKIVKNTLAANATPGTEDLRNETFSTEAGLTISEMAPFGVIGAFTPTTNPTETVINNSINVLAGGNGIVFCAHPNAWKVTTKMAELIDAVIQKAGGPANLVAAVANPTMEEGEKMTTNPKVKMLIATGGFAVVNVALKSGKKAIGAAAGNPPVIVDGTANIPLAAKLTVEGAQFDNNLLCIAEKEAFVVEKVYDEFIEEAKKNGAFIVSDAADIKKLEETILYEGGPHKDFIGKPAHYILDKAGISAPAGTRLAIVETDNKHPFVQKELLMPVLAVVKAKDFEEALEFAVDAEHGFGHTAMIHSRCTDNVTKFIKTMKVTIAVQNGSSYNGLGVGTGPTTFTVAGPTGEGITTPRHFVKYRRIAIASGGYYTR